MSIETVVRTGIDTVTEDVVKKIDYKARLQKLNLTEDQIGPELVARFREHLTTYEAGVEANLLAFEERMSSGEPSSVEERITQLREWLVVQEKNAPRRVADVGDAAKEVLDAVSKEAKKAAEKAGGAVEDATIGAISKQADTWLKGFLKGIPFIGENLANNDGLSVGDMIGSWIKKFIAAIGAGGFLGKFFGSTAEASEANPVGKGEEKTKKGVKDGEGSPRRGSDSEVAKVVKREPDVVPPETGEVISYDTERLALYKSGANLIFSLGGGIDDTNEGRNHIFEQLQGLSFHELLTLNENRVSELTEEGNEKQERLIREMLTIISSSETDTLLRVGLSSISVQNIIDPNKKEEISPRLSRYFGENPESGKTRLQEILALTKREPFDWKQLSFEEVSILYISSIPALRIPVIDGVSEELGGISSFFGESILDSDIDSNIYVLPTSVLKGFKHLGFDGMQKNTYMDKNKDSEVQNLVLQDLSAESPEHEEGAEVLQKIFTMKEYLLGEFSGEEKLHLSPEQQVLFKENLDYTGVLSLYSILGGVPGIASLNPLSLPILLYAVSKVIGSGNNTESFEGSLYLGNYLKEAFLNGKSTGLNDDELEVLKIYGKRGLDLVLLAHLDGVYKTMGLASGITGLSLTEIGVSSLAAGFATNQIGKWRIRKGLAKQRISLFGGFLKKLGLVGMFAGGAIGGTGFLLEKGNPRFRFIEDAHRAIETGNESKFFEILRQQEESIKSYETPDGEKMIISSYEGDKPFIVLNGKVYGLNIGNRDLGDSAGATLDKLLEGDTAVAIKFAGRLLPSSATGIVKGVDFKQQRLQGEDIVFGEGTENIYILPISALISSTRNNPTKIGNDFLHMMTEEEMTIPGVGSEGITGLPISILSENHILYMSELGNLGELE